MHLEKGAGMLAYSNNVLGGGQGKGLRLVAETGCVKGVLHKTVICKLWVGVLRGNRGYSEYGTNLAE